MMPAPESSSAITAGLLFRRPLTDAELDNRIGLLRRITERTNDFYAGRTQSQTACRSSAAWKLCVRGAVLQASPSSGGTKPLYRAVGAAERRGSVANFGAGILV